MLLFGRHGKMIRHEVNILRPLRGGGTGQSKRVHVEELVSAPSFNEL